jgi:hypothetical protein
MGYKLLGYGVWQALKWYLQGRVPGASRKLPSSKIALAAGLGTAVIAGAAVLAQRRAAAE